MNETDGLKKKLNSSNDGYINYFVAIDILRNRICICGGDSNFMATKINNKWEKGYPEFEDLVENYSEEKDIDKIQKFSSEAIDALSKVIKEKIRKK